MKYLRQTECGFSSEGTEEMFEMVDEAFDIMNSRSARQFGTKAPLHSETVITKLDQLKSISLYLSKLKLLDGTPVLQTPRRYAILGFIIAANSLQGLFIAHLQSYSVFLTHRLSQDHIELLFNVIRRRGGWNNNPSALHLRGAFRSVLLGCGCHSANFGNVLPLEDTPMPNEINMEDENLNDILGACEFELDSYITDSVTYICGWVALMANKRLNCSICNNCLINMKPNKNTFRLIAFKNRGGLLYPSEGLIKLFIHAEKLFRKDLLFEKILSMTFEKYGRIGTLFDDAEQHFEVMTHGITSHYFSLVKFCVETYLNVRFHHNTKLINENKQRQSRRQKLNKMILFNNT
jgi:hypothetical protein